MDNWILHWCIRTSVKNICMGQKEMNTHWQLTKMRWYAVQYHAMKNNTMHCDGIQCDTTLLSVYTEIHACVASCQQNKEKCDLILCLGGHYSTQSRKLFVAISMFKITYISLFDICFVLSHCDVVLKTVRIYGCSERKCHMLKES